jgi:hypothetical protein
MWAQSAPTDENQYVKSNKYVIYCGYIVHKSRVNIALLGDMKETTWIKRDYA